MAWAEMGFEVGGLGFRPSHAEEVVASSPQSRGQREGTLTSVMLSSASVSPGEGWGGDREEWPSPWGCPRGPG